MDYKGYKEQFNICPNEQQELAITSMDKPTLLQAVPGSGKTTTVVYRAGYMVNVLGIEPSKILVLSFSRSTAFDIQNRYISIFGEKDAAKIQFRTVNNLCDQIVFDYYRDKKMKKPRLIKDNTFMLRGLFSDIYHRAPAANEINDIRIGISRIKNLQLSGDILKRQTVGNIKLLPIYNAYQKELKRTDQIDYDDQVLMVYDIFYNDKEFLKKRQELAPHILVDEAQDTSKLQHEIINFLAEGCKSIMMVGDEHQTIHGFRAAYPAALIDFTKRYPEAEIIKFNQNYRSTPQIVQLANVSLSQNNRYVSNKMFTEREAGQKVKFSFFNKREEQYSAIAEKLLPHYEGETAVLYRNNNSAIPLILELVEHNIPFRCYGMDTLFFNSRVVNDIKNVMNSAFQPHNQELLWSTYNLFDTRLDESIIHEALDTADKRRYLSLWHKIFYKCDINRETKERVRLVITTVSAIRKGCTAREAIDHICNAGYKRAGSDETYILKTLAHEGESVKDFLSRLTDIEKVVAERINDTTVPDTVQYVLSNIHASKGIEYDNVIIMDEVSPVFPALHGDPDEELRLFYVAVTRAKNVLILLSYADSKQPYIDWLQNLNRNNHGRGGHQARKSSHSSARVGLSGGAVDASQLVKGVRVNHKKYGDGTVEGIVSDTIEISFDDNVSRKFKLSLCLGSGSLTVIR